MLCSTLPRRRSNNTKLLARCTSTSVRLGKILTGSILKFFFPVLIKKIKQKAICSLHRIAHTKQRRKAEKIKNFKVGMMHSWSFLTCIWCLVKWIFRFVSRLRSNWGRFGTQWVDYNTGMLALRFKSHFWTDIWMPSSWNVALMALG